jgi:hypothetical protein
MTQLTISLANKHARLLRQSAKKNAKPLEDYARELLEWYALAQNDSLLLWKPLKHSGKGVTDSSIHHDKYLYGKK